MKKLAVVTALIVLSFSLSSCWKSKPAKTENVGEIDRNASIENKAQAQKICAPFMRYLECSLEKAPQASKEVYENLIARLNLDIANEAPDRVAQSCDFNINYLKLNPELAYRNGCNFEEESPTPAQ
jgi:hypothetical protein